MLYSTEDSGWGKANDRPLAQAPSRHRSRGSGFSIAWTYLTTHARQDNSRTKGEWQIAEGQETLWVTDRVPHSARNDRITSEKV